MNEVDDVQRAVWVLSGKCKGCGCTVGDALEIHIEGCEFDKDYGWREELKRLKRMLLYVDGNNASLTAHNTILYKGRQVGKTVVAEMMNEFYKSLKDTYENTNS